MWFANPSADGRYWVESGFGGVRLSALRFALTKCFPHKFGQFASTQQGQPFLDRWQFFIRPCGAHRPIGWPGRADDLNHR